MVVGSVTVVVIGRVEITVFVTGSTNVSDSVVSDRTLIVVDSVWVSVTVYEDKE